MPKKVFAEIGYSFHYLNSAKDKHFLYKLVIEDNLFNLIK